MTLINHRGLDLPVFTILALTFFPFILIFSMEEGLKQKEQHQSRGRIRQRPRQKVPNSTSDGAGSLVADGSMVTRLETSSDDALPPPYGEQHMKFSQPGIDAGAEATGKTSLRRDPRVERFKTVDLKVQTRGTYQYMCKLRTPKTYAD